MAASLLGQSLLHGLDVDLQSRFYANQKPYGPGEGAHVDVVGKVARALLALGSRLEILRLQPSAAKRRDDLSLIHESGLISGKRQFHCIFWLRKQASGECRRWGL